jgi:hypothetical protein
MSELDKVIDVIAAAQKIVLRGNAEFELRTLRAIEAWAKSTRPFKAGDQIQLRDGYMVPSTATGWQGYRDRLVGGARGVVRNVHFNVYCGARGDWQFDVVFDWDARDGVFAFSASSLRLAAEQDSP